MMMKRGIEWMVSKVIDVEQDTNRSNTYHNRRDVGWSDGGTGRGDSKQDAVGEEEIKTEEGVLND